MADLPPPSIKHRCLEYCYTKVGRSTGRSTPLSIEHRCLEYHYTKHCRSTGRYTPQSSIDSLNTPTPNLADLLTDLPPSIKHRCLEYYYTKPGRSTGRYTPSIKHRCLEYCYTKLGRSSGTEGALHKRPFTHKGNYLVTQLIKTSRNTSIHNSCY